MARLTELQQNTLLAAVAEFEANEARRNVYARILNPNETTRALATHYGEAADLAKARVEELQDQYGL